VYSCSSRIRSIAEAGTCYERGGDVKDVVFPCGQTIGADGDTIHLYYGAGDSCVALAYGSVRELLSWLDANCSKGDATGF
jgi:predicted GH43/DUF377 family glycosyl hydrolase